MEPTQTEPATRTAATYHVLLIGIDDYQTRPLHGCVNDIDAIQRLLLDGCVGLTPDRICRLASPLPGTPHETAVPSLPATFEHVRDRLAALGSGAVAPGDRVIVYFAGHGTRVPVITATGRRTHRNALVPVDGFHHPGEPRLLFEPELDALLAAIAARTRNVTVILDSCYSAGALRTGVEQPGERARFLPIPDAPAWQELPEPPRAAPAGAGDPARGRDDCQIVAACRSYERAYETHGHGVSHGLLTRALVHALGAAHGDLRTVAWSQIWHAMRAEVEDHHPWQHLWLAGNPARAVLAGCPADASPGLSVTRTSGPHPRYHVAAGSLAGVTPGAVIAIYGDRPRQFARLDSPDDHAARISGLLHVVTADRAAAIAKPVPGAAGAPATDGDGARLELPAGARGRLVTSGAPERLRCALVPDHAELAAALAASPLLELVEPSRAQVRLELAGGRWFVTDDVHGAHGDEPVLVALGPHDLDRARRVLEHYYAYAVPLRMAARATDLPGGLELTVLTCPDHELAPAEALAASWPELSTRAPATYEASPGARLCVRVRNTSRERLRVTLVCATSIGNVQLLGDEVIDAATSYVFWHHNRAGAPFTLPVSPGAPRWVDRLVAIGRTAMAKDLGYLRLEPSFAEIIHPIRTRDIPDSSTHKTTTPPEQWTAALALLDTRRHSATSATLGDTRVR